MYVDKTLPTWEVNVLKAIASQLQVDTQGENLKKSKTNHVPVESETVGVYKTIEVRMFLKLASQTLTFNSV